MVKIEVATSLLLGTFFVGYMLGALIGTSLIMLAFFVMATIANVLWQRGTLDSGDKISNHRPYEEETSC